MWWAPSAQMPRESHSDRPLVPQCLICNTHISYMLWKHRKYESSLSPGKLRKRASSTGRSGQEARGGIILVKKQHSVPHSLCHPAAHTKSNLTSKPPPKGFPWPLSGCHSPSDPGFFPASIQPGNCVRTCPFCGGRWLWRYPEMQEI